MVKQKKPRDELIGSVKSGDLKSKPTADQLRIAEILEKKVVDSSIKVKLKQIMDATQRSADEVYVALHDSDFDVNRAVNLLIEGDSMADWCTSEKKKKRMQDVKEKKEEIVVEPIEEPKARSLAFRGRGLDRQRVGRGRGDRPERRAKEEQNIRGRGSWRGRRSQRPPLIFERSNAQSNNVPELRHAPPVRNQWEKPLLHSAEDDWDSEEFSGSLSQTQIFTSTVKQAKTDVPAEDPKLLDEEMDCGTAEQPGQASLTQMTAVDVQQDLPEAKPRSSPPADVRAEFIFRLSNYQNKSVSPQEDRKPSKIPTTAVEMPPEPKTSFSFLDIQFGAMDLGASDSNETQSNGPSQNASTTTLLPPSSVPSSSSMTHLMGANSVSSSASATNLVASSSVTNVATSPMQPSSASGIHHVPAPALSNQTQGRFIQSTQPFNVPYNFMTPPSPQFDSTDSASLPHLAPPHLPPFKQAPPKGAIVASLPPGPLVANQYILNQGNVPYFPHHPIYYYEDVPSVINNQQRLAHHISSGYDVGYQPSNPPNRDSVHYNV